MNPVNLTWRPEPLTARLIAAATPARLQVARAAQVKAPKGVKVSVIGEFVGSHEKEAIFFELGTDPHTIEPKKRVLRLADGSFVSGPVRHPGMKARPFLRPAMVLWPTLYKRQASGAFRGI